MVSIATIRSARADIAKRRAELDNEERELEIAERVWSRLSGQAETAKRPGRQKSAGGIAPAYAVVLAAIDGREGTIARDALRTEIDAGRLNPISDNGFTTLLSKMRGAKHIETEGDVVRRARVDDGGSGVS